MRILLWLKLALCHIHAKTGWSRQKWLDQYISDVSRTRIAALQEQKLHDMQSLVVVTYLTMIKIAMTNWNGAPSYILA